ncbi:MAG TPA: phosphate ABC transporter permease PstA [Pseudolysinimonas sp.]|jgi:phosphate transport system permease protein
MTATLSNRRPRSSITNAFADAQLPRLIELWLLLGSAIVVGGALMLVGFNLAAWAALSAVLYVVAIGVASRLVENGRKAVDRVVRALVTIAFLLAIIPLISTLWTVVAQGIGQLNWSFISHTGEAHFDPATLKVTSVPGALQAVVGTLEITGIATLISVPIGLLTSIYLVEYGLPTSLLRRAVTFLVDVMTGIPSIVAGLFAFSLFTLIVGPKAFSGLSASIALSVLMIPIVVRSSEEMLRLVPNELREASYALGVSKRHTIAKIVLRTAVSGIVTGVVLAIARVIGETAPIFIAAGFTDNFNANPLSNPQQTLAVLAYTGIKFPGHDIAASNQEAWGAALLLVILVIIFNIIARVVASIFAPKSGR